VTRLGGIPERSVTRHTNVLVIGDINPAALAPGMATTGKAARAIALTGLSVRAGWPWLVPGGLLR
jgi:hypothetical protein